MRIKTLHIQSLTFQVPSGRLITTIPGHFSLVYELNWSADDENLLSASADGTVRYVDCSAKPKGSKCLLGMQLLPFGFALTKHTTNYL